MNLFEVEIEEFLMLLNKNNVKYLLVGGLAVNFYGYARTTGDVDLWLEDSLQNRSNLVASLKEYNIEGAEIFTTHPLMAGFSEILLDNGIYVDFMSELQFLKQDEFKECYDLADYYCINSTDKIPVIHINKLIEEKSKSSRAKDIEDAEKLIGLYRKK